MSLQNRCPFLLNGHMLGQVPFHLAPKAIQVLCSGHARISGGALALHEKARKLQVLAHDLLKREACFQTDVLPCLVPITESLPLTLGKLSDQSGSMNVFERFCWRQGAWYGQLGRKVCQQDRTISLQSTCTEGNDRVGEGRRVRPKAFTPHVWPTCASNMNMQLEGFGDRDAQMLAHPVLHQAGPVLALRADVNLAEDGSLKLHSERVVLLPSSCFVGFQATQLIMHALHHAVVQSIELHGLVQSRT